MKFFFALIAILFIVYHLSRPVFAASWHYPLDHTLERQSYKNFGQYIDKQFYVGKENLFPTQFIGYHVGWDLEMFPNEAEQNVPVYAVSAGTISYSGVVDGYGGLILEQIEGENTTVLYGHLKPSSLVPVGNQVAAGQQIALLGNAFSNETAGERKHLHFGVYRGTDQYFRGYEKTTSDLLARWLDPMTYLKEKGAIEPNNIIPSTIPSKNISSPIPSISPVNGKTTFAGFWEMVKQILLSWGFHI